MILSRVILKNWKNFRIVDIRVSNRNFIIGPNASGKSNFLDSFRFLRDLCKAGGGLQRAVEERGGISKIRCLAARQNPDVEIEVYLSDSADKNSWRYAIGIRQEVRGYRLPIIAYERVWRGKEQILNRPTKEDTLDKLRLTQTHLEQINMNQGFRDIYHFFEEIQYLHLVPQLVRSQELNQSSGIQNDPFGRYFLEYVSKTPEKTRISRLKKIEEVLRIAVPQLKQLSDIRDENGKPHLEVLYDHWRPKGAKQREDQFSDGTLRLIGLLWTILDGDSLLLLEEPELSLHPAIVRRLPALIHRLLRQKKRQLLVSTHSTDLLDDKSISGEETLLLIPSAEGTKIELASDIARVKALLETGMSVGEVVMPIACPNNIEQLEFFK